MAQQCDTGVKQGRFSWQIEQIFGVNEKNMPEEEGKERNGKEVKTERNEEMETQNNEPFMSKTKVAYYGLNFVHIFDPLNCIKDYIFSRRIHPHTHKVMRENKTKNDTGSGNTKTNGR